MDGRSMCEPKDLIPPTATSQAKLQPRLMRITTSTMVLTAAVV